MASIRNPVQERVMKLNKILQISETHYTMKTFLLATISAYICFKNPCDQDLGHIASEYLKIIWAPNYLVWRAFLVYPIKFVWLCCTYVFPPCKAFLGLVTSLHQYAHNNPIFAAIIVGFFTTYLLLLPSDREVEGHNPHPDSPSAADASTDNRWIELKRQASTVTTAAVNVFIEPLDSIVRCFGNGSIRIIDPSEQILTTKDQAHLDNIIKRATQLIEDQKTLLEDKERLLGDKERWLDDNMKDHQEWTQKLDSLRQELQEMKESRAGQNAEQARRALGPWSGHLDWVATKASAGKGIAKKEEGKFGNKKGRKELISFQRGKGQGRGVRALEQGGSSRRGEGSDGERFRLM